MIDKFCNILNMALPDGSYFIYLNGRLTDYELPFSKGKINLVDFPEEWLLKEYHRVISALNVDDKDIWVLRLIQKSYLELQQKVLSEKSLVEMNERDG